MKYHFGPITLKVKIDARLAKLTAFDA